jgi:hypothetical protein
MPTDAKHPTIVRTIPNLFLFSLLLNIANPPKNVFSPSRSSAAVGSDLANTSTECTAGTVPLREDAAKPLQTKEFDLVVRVRGPEIGNETLPSLQ